MNFASLSSNILDSLASTHNATKSFLSSTDTHTIADYYGKVDFGQLNFLERTWANYYMLFSDPILATGIMSFLWHELVYFGRCLPWIMIDQMPSMRKYKIQDAKIPSAQTQWECTKYVLWTHFTIELPQIYLFHPLAEFFGMKTYHVPFPSLFTILYQLAIFFVLEDFWHYWNHRALHYGPLYRRIHTLHHKHSAPFGLAAEFAHPIEVMFLGLGTVGAPIAWCWWSGGNLHIFTMYMWIGARLFQAIDAHSGYDFPWSLHNFVPFWSGADHHDFHHMNFIGCYASSFRWLDHIFGTDRSFKAWKKRQAEAAAKGKEAKFVHEEKVEGGKLKAQ